MSVLSFRALASGSSGNAFLLQTRSVNLLFDAGLSVRKLQAYLASDDVPIDKLSAVLISHEHTDHCSAARDLAQRFNVPIWSNVDVLRAAGLHDLPQSVVLTTGQPVLFRDVEVICFPVSHDAVQPMGFRIQTRERTITIATDLGQPTPELMDAVGAADLVVLEANHDIRMLQEGKYPYHLRRRVSGPTGHLSNDQAASILRDTIQAKNVDVWLAHLSKENNTARLAARTVGSVLKTAGLDSVAISVASRDRPSLRWTGVPRPRQLSLFPDMAGL